MGMTCVDKRHMQEIQHYIYMHKNNITKLFLSYTRRSTQNQAQIENEAQIENKA